MDQETKQEFENLTRMMQGGFLELKDEITSVRSELKDEITSVRMELKKDIKTLDQKVENLTAKVTDIDEKVVDLDVKVSRIDMRTANQADSFYADMHAMDKRVTKVEVKVGIIPPDQKVLAV